jgi:hypothetical protein
MQVIKIEYNNETYTQDWQQALKTFPTNIKELVFSLILMNNFCGVNEFIKSRKQMLEHNTKAMQNNLDYLRKENVQKVEYMGKKVTVNQYKGLLKNDIEIIKKQLQFADEIKHIAKVTIE